MKNWFYSWCLRFSLYAIVHLAKRIILEHRAIWADAAVWGGFFFSLAFCTENVAGKAGFLERRATWTSAELTVFFVIWHRITQNFTKKTFAVELIIVCDCLVSVTGKDKRLISSYLFGVELFFQPSSYFRSRLLPCPNLCGVPTAVHMSLFTLTIATPAVPFFANHFC